MTGIEKHKKLLSLLNSPSSLCVEYEISSKLIHLPFFVQNFQKHVLTDDSAYIDWRQKLQKSIATIEFTALDLCRVWNFIRIEAFTAFHPKLWPERWHVPTLVDLIPRSPFPFLKISYFKLRYCLRRDQDQQDQE